MANQTYSLYTNGSEIVGLHMANMPNRMLLQSEHIPCIPVVLKRSVCTCQICQMKCYCTPNIYPIYKWFRNCGFAHLKHAKYNDIVYTLYTNGSEIISLHMSNRPNNMLLHSEHITYILLVQKPLVHTKAEHDSESPMSFYEFTHESTHKYHTHESQVPMSMGFQGSKY